MKQLIGVRLSTKLIEQMKEYISEQKKEHPYSMTELIHNAVKAYLKSKEE